MSIIPAPKKLRLRDVSSKPAWALSPKSKAAKAMKAKLGEKGGGWSMEKEERKGC